MTIIGIVFCWVPFVHGILWFLGLLFSFIGVFKRPKALAIVGLVLSLVSIVIYVIVVMVFLGGSLYDSLDLDSLLEEMY